MMVDANGKIVMNAQGKTIVGMTQIPNKTACFQAAFATILSFLTGKDITSDELGVRAGKNGGITDTKINNEILVAAAAGLKNVDWKSINPSGNFEAQIIAQLNANNPVKLNSAGNQDSWHSEVIYGYEKWGKQTIFKVYDPGWQGDTYFDPKSLSLFHMDKGKPNYSVVNPWNPLSPPRKVTSFGWYEKK